MSQNYDLYLQDVAVAADRIASYVEGVTRAEFEADQMRIDAVIRLSVKQSRKSPIQFKRGTQAFHGRKLQG